MTWFLNSWEKTTRKLKRHVVRNVKETKCLNSTEPKELEIKDKGIECFWCPGTKSKEWDDIEPLTEFCKTKIATTVSEQTDNRSQVFLTKYIKLIIRSTHILSVEDVVSREVNDFVYKKYQSKTGIFFLES